MGRIRSRYIRQNLAYWDTHRKRLVGAVGQDVSIYNNAFTDGLLQADASDPIGMTSTVVEAGAGTTEFSPGNESGGVGVITTAANENDGGNYQVLGESFKLVSTAELYFGARFKVSEATQSDYFIGLAITDTDILGGVTDSIGFRKVDGSTSVAFLAEKNSTESATAGVLTQDTSYHILEFYWDGTNYEAFVDGASVAGPALTNLPDDEEMRVSVQYLAGSAGAKTMTLDWIRCIQIGK